MNCGYKQHFMLSYVDSKLFVGAQMDDKRRSIKLSIELGSQEYMKDKCEHDELVPVCRVRRFAINKLNCLLSAHQC